MSEWDKATQAAQDINEELAVMTERFWQSMLYGEGHANKLTREQLLAYSKVPAWDPETDTDDE